MLGIAFFLLTRFVLKSSYALYLRDTLRDYCECRKMETGNNHALMLSTEIYDLETCDVYEDRLVSRAQNAPPQLSIVVMAYLPSMSWRLERLVCGYAKTYKVVRKVLVIWNGPQDQLPNASCAVEWWSDRRGKSFGAYLESGRKYAHQRVEFELIVEEKNTLLNRYRHARRIPTKTVILQDDDVIHGPLALRTFAWTALALPKQILGTPPERDYSSETTQENTDKFNQYRFAYVYHPRKTPHQSYSFLLGQTSILDSKYLEQFLQGAPRKSLKFILTHKPTCEDLTLHFFVANATRLPPAVFADLVPRQILGPRSAQMHLGSKKIWSHRRARCLDRLVDDFDNSMPLVKSICRLYGNITIADPIFRAAYLNRNHFFANSKPTTTDDDFFTIPYPRMRRRRRRKINNATLSQGGEQEDDTTSSAMGDIEEDT